MRSCGRTIRLAFYLAFCATGWYAQSHSLPDPDRVITLELTEPNVERLASQVDAVLRAYGFTKVSSSPRMTLDAFQLPSSARIDEGIILARFEEKSGISLFAQITSCRAAITMRLPDVVDKVTGRSKLLAIQARLKTDLAARTHIPVSVIEGLSDRENPCAVPVRSNKSLERTREG